MRSGFEIEKYMQREDTVRCGFTVNSEKRANNWLITIPELKSPDLWNWKAVEKNARRLIRDERIDNVRIGMCIP